ncbi:hypothetical protein THAOC_00583, partial [Thalassiosira oceanica]
SERRGGTWQTSHVRSTATADAEFTVLNVVPIGADAEVARPPTKRSHVYSRHSNPSGGRESYRSILTKSGMDHKPVSLLQATADAPPPQTPLPSGAPTLTAPANNITPSIKGGQGKDPSQRSSSTV